MEKTINAQNSLFLLVCAGRKSGQVKKGDEGTGGGKTLSGSSSSCLEKARRRRNARNKLGSFSEKILSANVANERHEKMGNLVRQRTAGKTAKSKTTTLVLIQMP